MDMINWITTWILPFLGVLGALVFFHELGHYQVARWCGVKVESFSIGFGPELFGWTDRVGTRWRVSALPLGGYVKFFGDPTMTQAGPPEITEYDNEGESQTRPLTDEERDGCFFFKPLWQRAAVVAAGPLANFLLAILLFAGLFMSQGQLKTDPTVGEVLPGTAAERAGLQPGDRFLAVDGAAVERFQEVQHAIMLNPGIEVLLTMERAGEILEIPVVPDVDLVPYDYGEHKRGLLGVRSGANTRFIVHDPLSALWQGARTTWDYTVLNVRAVGQMLSGYRSVTELGGPFRIAHVTGEVSQHGFYTVLKLMAILSIGLGLVNLVPIPVLDGGHLLYYSIEAVRGKPLGLQAQEFGLKIGLALVAFLMIVVSLNDLVSGPFWNS